MPLKIDATRPFYAYVGVVDLAVERARSYTVEVQSRLSAVDIEPTVLRDQARTVVTARVDELTKEAKEAQARFEARVADLQADAKAFPKKAESYLDEAVEEITETYGDLAARGKNLVTRIRRQQATQDAKAAGKTTVAKAKTTRTQTAKSAKKTAGTARTAAKQTASTAKRNTKATTTAAKKTAAAATKATADAAAKTGN